VRNFIEAYRTEVGVPATRINLAGDRDGVIELMGSVGHITNGLFEAIDGLKSTAITTTQSISDDTSGIALFAKIFLGVLSAIAIGVGVMFAMMITRSIVTSLQDSMSRMSGSVDIVASSSRELSSASRTLAESASNQAAGIEETSATMNETASMIKLTKENTQHVARLSDEAEKSTDDSLRSMETLMGVMNKLNESSSQIEKIADNINSIASQTNILALNASVEAVRVGEAGKGFAVVAEEVRDLSIQSADAARNTTDIIKENIALAIQGVENSKMVSSSLNIISDDVRQINELMGEIATATEEQSKGVDQIAIAITQMEQSTQANAAVAEQSSAAADELLITSDDLKLAADALDAMI
jgi:methyl-accepting chemotaxis protein